MTSDQKMLALGHMLPGLIHNLNNALSPVLGYSELLLETSNSPAHRELLERIEQGSLRAVGILRTLELFCRGTQRGQPQSVSLASIVHRYLDGGRGRVGVAAETVAGEHPLQLELDETVFVIGVEDELTELLDQLVTNAEEASPPHAPIHVRAFRRGADACLEVADTGIGMSADIRERCLEPFQSTKSEIGAGMGLSICWGISRRHGGTLSIEAESGSGTRVAFVLPASVEPAE
jgi:signal transduction histidine kinase